LSVLISVVVPVYNVEKYLKKCIESIINQTYKNIEIICINDGSKDSSPAILEEIAKNEPRLRVFHQENQGLMSVRMRGIAEANGEYIAFVDSDDYVSPNMLEILLEGVQKNGAQIAVCAFEVVDEKGKLLFNVIPRRKIIDKNEALKELMFKDYRETGLYPLWNKLYKKELFNGFAPDKKVANMGEDQFINLTLIDKSQNVYFSDMICYSYVQRVDSFMKIPKLSHIDDFFGFWGKKWEIADKLNLFQTNKSELFDAYFNSVFDFYGLCYQTDKQNLIPIFSEKLAKDRYFKIKNLPIKPKNIIRCISFLIRRYF